MKNTIYIGLTNSAGETDLRERALAILSRRLEAFTTLDAAGYWRGHPEPSLVVEVIGDLPPGLVEELRDELGQECVGLFVTEGDWRLV